MLCVQFPFSTDIYGQDLELFEHEAFTFKSQLQYRWPYWSDIGWLDLTAGRSSSGKGIDSYHMSVFLSVNDAKPEYVKKLKEIVQEGKKKAGNDQYKLVNYFCQWLDENVDYTMELMTNSAYYAVMEGEAICGGYANALRDLCEIAGITCLVHTNGSCLE